MKAILIIDMPNSCYECPIGVLDFGNNSMHCRGGKFVEDMHLHGIPEKCPLKPIPEMLSLESVEEQKKTTLPSIIKTEWYQEMIKDHHSVDVRAYTVGYNQCLKEFIQCLEEIEGETE